MAELLRSRARPLGAATLTGILLDLGSYPGAIPSAAPGASPGSSPGSSPAASSSAAPASRDVVHGELYELDPAHESRTLLALDDYEGYDPEDPVRSLFVRIAYPIQHAGTTSAAWVYFFNGDPATGHEIASGDALHAFRSPRAARE